MATDRLALLRQAGFTLIELMVVVAIIGIVISFAGISLRQHGDERLETEAKRIHQLIKMASDEAVMQSREYALRLAEKDYMFLTLDPENGQFIPIESDSMFRLREFDPDYRLKLDRLEFELDFTQCIVHTNGTKEWWVDDKLHRVGGPALVWSGGAKEWWVDDKRHRDDGPAIIWANGSKEWWVKGICRRKS